MFNIYIKRNEYQSEQVSFVIPCHSDEGGLEKCLMAALDQTIEDYDIWVSIDGEQEDQTKEMAQKFYEDTDKVHLIIGDKRVGPSVARNRALNMTSARYAALCDTDDYSTRDRLEKQLDIIEQNSVSFCGDFLSNCDVKENSKYEYMPQDFTTFNYFAMSSLMVPTSIRYRPKFKYGELYDIQLLMITNLEGDPKVSKNVCRKKWREDGLVNLEANYRYYRRKAIEFFEQRKKTGKDNYDNWTPLHEHDNWKKIP